MNSYTVIMSEQGFILNSLGQAVAYFRKRKGLSQELLSIYSDLAPSYIGHIEHGERNVTIKVLAKICNTLEIKPSQLFKQAEKYQ